MFVILLTLSVSILGSVRNHHCWDSAPVTMGAPGVTPGQVTTSCAQPRLWLVHRPSPGLWLADQGPAPTSVWCHNTAIRAQAVTNPTQPADIRYAQQRSEGHICVLTLCSQVDIILHSSIKSYSIDMCSCESNISSDKKCRALLAVKLELCK